MHSLKVENDDYLADKTEDSSPGHSLSVALRDGCEEVRGEPGSTGVFATKIRQSEHQR